MYVPEYSSVPAVRPITIHDLLTLTAGIGAMGLGQAVSEWGELQWDKAGWIKSGHTLESYINMMASGPLDFQPGSRWGYSIGLDVVARIIEITSGQPYNEFVHENIFDPLDMKDTYWFNSIPLEKRSRLVALPDPDNPVITTSLSLGISTSIDFRLCSLAPRTWINLSSAINNLRSCLKR